MALLHSLTNWGQLHELNCAKEVYHIPQNNPILSNRYIYYPDHLVALPSGIIRGFFKRLKFIYKLLTEPVFQGTLPALYRWQTSGAAKYRDSPQGDQPPNKLAIAGIQDISVGEYLLARTGSTSLVNNLASAVLHGIWGGDVWKLSALEGTFQNDYLRYKLPLRQGDGAKALVKHSDYFSGSDILMRTPEVADFVSLFAKDAYLGFGKGFSTLANELVDELRRNPKVTIKQATPVTHLRYNREAKQTSVTTASKETQGHDKVISSLYSGTLAKLTGDALPALKGSAAVTIQIVNLWYEKVQLEKNYPGFGYLIPQSVPLENNPHAALGVIFDSDRDAAAGIDDRPDRGTNLTVMLGGHYWDHIDPTLWPSEKEVIAMAKDTVQRQLGISAEEPCRASTKLCRDCIPQHLVGHRDRMAQAHRELCDSFEGTLAVVGGSYTMPGVLPSLQAARDVALAASGQGYMVDPELRGNTFAYDMKHVGETGLGRFVGDNETLQLVPLQELPFRGKSRVRRFNHSSFQQ